MNSLAFLVTDLQVRRSRALSPCKPNVSRSSHLQVRLGENTQTSARWVRIRLIREAKHVSWDHPGGGESANNPTSFARAGSSKLG
jgi:hypothetical protein